MNVMISHSLNWVDYFIVAVILFSTLISLMRGFIAEAISLLTWILAVVVAFQYSSKLSVIFAKIIHTPSVRMMISFIILFIIILILGAIVNHFFAVFLRSTGLSGTNRVLGMVFGFARGVLLIAIFMLLAEFTSMTKEPWWSQSQFIPYFQNISTWLQQFIPTQFSNVSHYIANHKLGSS